MSQQPPARSGNLIMFMLMAFSVVMLYQWVFKPPQQPKDENQQVAAADNKGEEKDDKDKKDLDKDGQDKKVDGKDKKGEGTEISPKTNEGNQEGKKPEKPDDKTNNLLPTDNKSQDYITLGSADPDSPYAMLVTLTNRGAAVARVELNSPRYPQLMDDDGYLVDRRGYLGRIVIGETTSGRGCRVDVVGKGTPADEAGIEKGDAIIELDGQKVAGKTTFFEAMAKTRPGRTISIKVLRSGKELDLTATLTRPPVEVLRPEGDDPLSFLMTLSRLGDDELKETKPKKTEDEEKPCPEYVTKELPGLNLRTGNWTIVKEKCNETQAVFECELKRSKLKLTKIFRLAKNGDEDDKADAYHLTLDLKLENLGDEIIKAAYQLDGPTGLPIEGWWYANKVGYCWTAGLRDVIVLLNNNKTPTMVGCTAIADDDIPSEWKEEPLTYIGVDAQYFSCVMIPDRPEGQEDKVWLAMSQPLRVGPVIDKDRRRLTNVSCRMRSKTEDLKPGKPFEHSYKIFTGPKNEQVLEAYNLGSLVTYGWFDFFARPMLSILHFFHGIVGNYGLAIILLTILVRGLMYPMSRKQALAAAKMAELQPEIKKIQAKYKDLAERHKAQQELFKKHNYNPMAGCLVMFIQLPIFIGLYRGLMVDVELRGSSLFGSWVRWCSNLAAPDMLIDWHAWMPNFITCGYGFLGLGPYFNLLPILTIVLFIVQQKLMMPPPADEAQAMQQKMMKYMMLFMGLLFFKVAAGLCIYFVASSLWGVAERKLLPKHPGQEKTQQATMSSAHRKKGTNVKKKRK